MSARTVAFGAAAPLDGAAPGVVLGVVPGVAAGALGPVVGAALGVGVAVPLDSVVGGGVVVLGGVAATVRWVKRSAAGGATTCTSIPAARSWPATASATSTSVPRSAPAATTMLSGVLPRVQAPP